MSKIKKLHIKNMAKITEIYVEPPDSGLLPIAGKNGAGKTSLLRSIFAGFGGEVPSLHDGATKGEVEIETEELKIKLTVTSKTDRLVVESKDTGEQLSSPKTTLKKIFGKRAFDVASFLRASAKEQIDILLKVVQLPSSLEDLKKITKDSVEYSVSENNTLIDYLYQAHDQLTAERKVINREIKELSGVVAQNETLYSVDPVDLEPLYKEKQDYFANQSIIQQIESKRQEIIRIEKEISFLESQKKETDSLELIEEKISKAKDQNVKANLYFEKKRAEVSQKKQEEKKEKVTSILEKLLEFKINVLKNTIFPLENGLDIQRNEIFYFNKPLREASGTDQLFVAMAIAMAEIPKDGLQALFIFDPPQVDKDHWQMFSEFAESRDIQLWIARVQEEKTGSFVYLIEGEKE